MNNNNNNNNKFQCWGFFPNSYLILAPICILLVANLVLILVNQISLKHSLKFKGKIWLDKYTVNIHSKFSTGFITQTITLVSG